MRTIFHSLILFSFLLIFASCEKEIKFNNKLIAPKLVINSFVSSDSLFEATIALSKAVPGVEKPFEWIDNAKVVLYTNDEKSEELQAVEIIYIQDDNNYYWEDNSNTRPKTKYRSIKTKAEAGKTYKIEVIHPEHGTAYGETTLPQPVEIISLKSEKTLMNYEWGGKDNQLIVTMKFKDTPNEDNYYRLSFTRMYGSSETFKYDETEKDTSQFTIYISTRKNGTNLNTSDPIFSNDEDANDFLFGSPGNYYNLFTDNLIDGKEYEISFVAFNKFVDEYSLDTLYNFLEAPGEFCKIDVKLSSLSREAFLYIKSSHAQDWYGEDFFSEPVQVFSNIENGIGIFAGYSSSVKSLTVGNYPIDTIRYELNEYDYYY